MQLDLRENKAFRLLKDYFSENKPDPVHDIDHIMRVASWADMIAEQEGAQKEIVMPAAILHDIAIPKYGDSVHARKGAEMCRPILLECGYDEEEIRRISRTIATHSTDDPAPPDSFEGKVLWDADKLDACGPCSLHRWFFELAKKGMDQAEAVEKIISYMEKWKIRKDPFFTASGERYGLPRIDWLLTRCKEIRDDLKERK